MDYEIFEWKSDENSEYGMLLIVEGNHKWCTARFGLGTFVVLRPYIFDLPEGIRSHVNIFVDDKN